MNRNKMQSILNWMQDMDPNGEWSAALEEADRGEITIPTLTACIVGALVGWADENCMSYEAMNRILASWREATK